MFRVYILGKRFDKITLMELTYPIRLIAPRGEPNAIGTPSETSRLSLQGGPRIVHYEWGDHGAPIDGLK